MCKQIYVETKYKNGLLGPHNYAKVIITIIVDQFCDSDYLSGLIIGFRNKLFLTLSNLLNSCL